MRISDWSSDVCSSDLAARVQARLRLSHPIDLGAPAPRIFAGLRWGIGPRRAHRREDRAGGLEALRKYFRKLRGIELEVFPSFDNLDLLQHLGNACRHGDGDSAAELARRCPDLWQHGLLAPARPDMPPDSPPIELPRSVALMDIPVERLHVFVSGIAEFWRDTGYIYKESIERKDPHLAARLVKERATRSWVPQMPLGDRKSTRLNSSH